ncbi:asc-type amino acid transporter 1-like [Haliotis rubra]|uniref:asc-type amino acid transporter 1-like n=1 Tax=Haliotis rubra TaxID=36100 RepID=UPI001EE50F1E|nr:asc-type amino acid transporter 1-like [Haliotis rubra]
MLSIKYDHLHYHTHLAELLPFQFILTAIYLCLGDVKSVLGAYSFFKAGGECVAIAGIFIIRRRHPATVNTYKVHWLFPVIYVVFFLVLSVTAITFDPRLYLPIFCITLLGVPLYFLSRSRWWQMGYLARVNEWITLICHRLLLCEHASQTVV